MHRTEGANNIEVGGKKQFTDGPPGTTVEQNFLNAVQEEIATIIEDSGGTLKTAGTETSDQLSAAVSALIASSSPNTAAVDFESKNLIINVQSNTTVDADADRLSFLNSLNVPTFQNDIDETFDITTDLMAGTSEKASTDYWMWLDSAGVRLLVPDLTGTTDSTTANKLKDSTADFVTDLVQVGDIVYNTTDLTQTTVTAVDSAGVLSVADDFFVSGEDYKIRMLSPVGIGASKSRIGAAYNNASSNFDDSFYTQIQEEKFYSEAAGDFTITLANFTTDSGIISTTQINDWTGVGVWHAHLNISGTLSVGTASIPIVLSGVVFKTGINQNVPAIGLFDVGSPRRSATAGSTITTTYSAATTAYSWSGRVELDKKPTFAK